jgi:hypothetical protein
MGQKTDFLRRGLAMTFTVSIRLIKRNQSPWNDAVYCLLGSLEYSGSAGMRFISVVGMRFTNSQNPTLRFSAYNEYRPARTRQTQIANDLPSGRL